MALLSDSAMLTKVQETIQDILDNGQSTRFGPRMMTLADLESLQDLLEYYQDRVDATDSTTPTLTLADLRYATK